KWIPTCVIAAQKRIPSPNLVKVLLFVLWTITEDRFLRITHIQIEDLSRGNPTVQSPAWVDLSLTSTVSSNLRNMGCDRGSNILCILSHRMTKMFSSCTSNIEVIKDLHAFRCSKSFNQSFLYIYRSIRPKTGRMTSQS